jgi:phage protein D
MVFDNYDLQITDNEEIAQGNVVSFRHGYIDDLSKEVYFTIGNVEGWKEITVEALEVVHAFNTEPKSRSWLESDLGSVVADIAFDNKLNAKTEERRDENGTPLLYNYIQRHVGDLQFLYTLGRKIGYEVWIDVDTLYFVPRQYWQTPYAEFTYEGEDGNVLDFKPKVNTMNRKGKFKGGGIDLEKKQTFFFTQNGQTKRSVYLNKKFFDFDKINARYKKLKEARLVRVPLNTKSEAEDILAGVWIKEMEDQITAELHLTGEPHLVARRVIQVSNVGQYSGKYYVKSVTHSGKDGYTSVARLTRNAAFDKGQKYSRENIESVINKERPSVKQFLKVTKGKPKGQFYKRLFLK